MKIFPRWLRALAAQVTGEKGKTPIRRRRLALQVELLEDRITPTILFRPQFVGENATDVGGYTLRSPPVHFLFWGSYWQQGDGPAHQNQVVDAAKKMFASAYFTAQTQYRTDSIVIFGDVANEASNPPDNFDASAITTVLKDAIDDDRLPESDDRPEQALYVVVTEPGKMSDNPDAGSYNSLTSDFELPADRDPEEFVWLGNGSTNAHFDIDAYSNNLSHEISEAVTDPQAADLFSGQAHLMGYRVTPGSGYPEKKDGGQIADYEPEPDRYVYRLNGVKVQAYWSQVDSAFVVPDGNHQVFELKPKWDGLTYKKHENQLIINGDQLRSDDVIRVESSTRLSPDSSLLGGLISTIRVTMNGEVAEFDADYLGDRSATEPGIIIKAGEGENIVDLSAFSSETLRVQVQDGGVPRLSIGDAQVQEGDTGTTYADFKVTLSSNTTVIPPNAHAENVTHTHSAISVDFTVVLGGTAAADDVEELTTPIRKQFEANEYEQTIQAIVFGDTRMERDETFVVNLSNPVGATIYDYFGLGTIIDDDTEAVYTTPTGPLDMTWGTGGIARSVSSPGDLAVDPDGRVVTFTNGIGATNGLIVTRYNPNGSLDTTFNQTGSAYVSYPFGLQAAHGAVYQSGPDRGSMIAVVNSTGSNFDPTRPSIVRFNLDGSRDMSFGGGLGYVPFRINTDGRSETVNSIVTYDSGEFLVVGASGGTVFAGPGRLIAARYFADGSLDSSFGSGGKINFLWHFTDNDAAILPYDFIGANRIAIDPSGGIIIAGNVGQPNTYSGAYGSRRNGGFVLRLTSGGSPDTTYGTGGITFVDFTQGFVAGTLNDMALAPDGKVTVVASSINGLYAQFYVARLKATGQFDPMFGSDGVLRIAPGLPAVSVLLDAAGNVLVSGPTGGTGSDAFYLTRLRPDGSFDNNFDTVQHDSTVSPDIGGGYAGIAESTILSGGSFLLLGSQYNRGNSNLTESTTEALESQRGDLSVTMTSDATEAPGGGNVVYTIRLRNTGDDAIFASLRDILPSELTFVSMVAPQDAWAISPFAQYTNGTIIAAIRNLRQSDGEQVFTITAAVRGNLPSHYKITNTVTVSSAILDTNATNNTATLTLPVTPLLVSIGDSSVPEGNAGTTDAAFTVTLNRSSWQTVIVDYSTANGGTALPGTDFLTVSGTVSFAPGETTKTISVPVVGDTQMEQDETFIVNLRNPGNVIVGDNMGLGTIRDDEWAVLTPPNPLDATFGAGGLVDQPIAGLNVTSYKVVVDSNDRPVSLAIVGGNVVLTRHNPGGQLDTTFGSATPGIVITGLPFNTGAAYALDVVRTGPERDEILVAGTLSNDTFLRRYRVDGSVDTTFGTNGVVQASFPSVQGTNDSAFDVTVYDGGPNIGKILVSGMSYLARLNPDGTFDTTFDPVQNATLNPVAGDAQIPLLVNGALAIGREVLVTPDNKIVVVGRIGEYYDTNNSIFVARYNDNATLDTTFGGGHGFVIVAPHVALYTTADGSAGALDATGRILVAGSNGQNALLARLTANGSLDPSFGSGGILVHSFGYGYGGVAVALDGKIVATGWAAGPSANTLKAIVTRLAGDGSFDNTFDSINHDGVVEISTSTRSYAGVSLALASDGKIVSVIQNFGRNSGTGNYDDDGHIMVARIEDDRPDLKIGVGTTDINPLSVGEQVTFTICVDNVGASAADRFTVSTAVPANTTFVSAIGDYLRVGNTLYFRGSSLPPGAHQHFEFVVQATAAGYAPATATLMSVAPDANSGDNTAASSSAIPVPLGIVSLWKAEGNARDSVGSNDGSLVNGATFAPGKVGQAFSFDGVNDFVSIPDPGVFNLDITGDLTIGAWIKPTSVTGPQRSIIDKRSLDGLNVTYGLFIETDGRLSFTARFNGGSFSTVHSSSTIPAGQFSYVAVTIQGTTLQLYINGAVVATTPYTTTRQATNGPVTIGVAPFAGLIDEPVIYNRALTAAEIQSIVSFGNQPVNHPPTVSFTSGAVIVDEGQTASNTGAVTDPDTEFCFVTMTASIGAVTFDRETGAWSWSYFAADGPAAQTVVIKANDGFGGIGTTTFTLSVNNVAPTIDLTGDAAPDEGSTFTLRLGTITDPGLDTVTAYSINWGDGTSENLSGNPANTTRTHVYGDGSNVYTIHVSLTDEDGAFPDATTLAVQVMNVEPNLTIGGAGSVDEGSPYTLNLSSSDPGADTIDHWTITWGDGNVQTIAGNPSSAMHAYADGPIHYSISATATDEDGTYDANTASVSVHNVAPTLSISGAGGVDEGTPYTLKLSSSDPGADTIAHWTITWGDGKVETVTGNPSSVMHTYADGPNSYTISAKATDEDGTFDANAITVSVHNVAPALSISVAGSVDEGTPYTLNLSSSDPGADTIDHWTITWGDGDVATVTGNPDSVTHTYADGPISYTISATATDEDGTYDANTVSVSVQNVAPSLTISGAGSVDEGTPYTLNLSSSDPGADTIDHWNISWGDGAIEIVVGNPSSAMHTYANGPNSYTIGATATDEDGTYDANTVSVSINNVAPTANLSGDAEKVYGNAAHFQLAGAADPSAADLAVLRFSFATSEGALADYAHAQDANTYDVQFAAGTYTIWGRVLDKDGGFTDYHQTLEVTPATQTVSLNLTGRVFEDLNNDGLFNGGDSGLSAVTVRLFNENDLTTAWSTQTTDGNGRYTVSATVPAGHYRIVVNPSAELLDGKETAGTLGGDVDNTQDRNFIGGIVLQAGVANATDYNFAQILPSRLQGLVWLDFNDDGKVDFGERAIAGVAIHLTGKDDRGRDINQTMTTDGQGIVEFTRLRPSDVNGYALSEDQPAGFTDGMESVGTVNGALAGTVGNDAFSQINLSLPGSEGVNYNFAERPTAGDQVHAGQTAGIGFWQNSNGQALIRSLNGGSQATQMGNWMAATLPNLYGATAGSNNLTGKTNSQIAAFFISLFKRTSSADGPPKVDAQVFATALAVYVTNQSLAGTTATAYGFQVTSNGVGAATFDVGTNNLAAFGLTANDSTVLTVLDLLLRADSRSRYGLLYDADGSGTISASEKSLRGMANNVFTAINQLGDI